MPGRKHNGGTYRYGFNGKETDSETGIQDYGMRWYLPNIARFASVDPLADEFPYYTPYQFSGNTPIFAIDLDGEEGFAGAFWGGILEAGGQILGGYLKHGDIKRALAEIDYFDVMVAIGQGAVGKIHMGRGAKILYEVGMEIIQSAVEITKDGIKLKSAKKAVVDAAVTYGSKKLAQKAGPVVKKVLGKSGGTSAVDQAKKAAYKLQKQSNNRLKNTKGKPRKGKTDESAAAQRLVGKAEAAAEFANDLEMKKIEEVSGRTIKAAYEQGTNDILGFEILEKTYRDGVEFSQRVLVWRQPDGTYIAPTYTNGKPVEGYAQPDSNSIEWKPVNNPAKKK
jgi:RHS repeat-associated protein